MAQDSRNKRKARRAKLAQWLAAQAARKTNRQIIQRLEERLVHTQFTLLTMLRAAGDSYVVSKETATAVRTGFADLTWRADQQENGSIKVLLHDRRTAEAPVTVPETPDVVAPRSVTAQLTEAPVVE